MTSAEIPGIEGDLVAAYKQVFREVLDRRPSGMRQRLAEALGKNRSFISQISSPSYPTPIPAQHIERIFEICHFSPQDRDRFLEAYRQAHPRRLRVIGHQERHRRTTLTLPDLGDDCRNRKLESAVNEFIERIIPLLRES
jgi:hypothetical protein